MASVSDQLTSLNKRVGALERKDQTETIIPLIIKQYQTLKISPVYCSESTFTSSNLIACGTIQDVATNFIDFETYGIVGDGTFANVGEVSSTGFENELFRKVSAGAESFDGTFIVDVFIEENEANEVTYTNSALLINANSSFGSGIIIAKNTDFLIYKTSVNTLTISTEINFEVI